MADNNLFELRIIEPDGMFFDGTSDFIELTTVEGQRGVYKHHVPLTAILEPCVIYIYEGLKIKKAAVMGGFVEIQKEKITILAEDASWPEEIDLARAEAAKNRAEERLRKASKDIDVARAEAALKRALVRINAVK